MLGLAPDILSFYTVYGEHLLPQRQYDIKVRNDTTITKIKNLVRAEIGST